MIDTCLRCYKRYENIDHSLFCDECIIKNLRENH